MLARSSAVAKIGAVVRGIQCRKTHSFTICTIKARTKAILLQRAAVKINRWGRIALHDMRERKLKRLRRKLLRQQKDKAATKIERMYRMFSAKRQFKRLKSEREQFVKNRAAKRIQKEVRAVAKRKKRVAKGLRAEPLHFQSLFDLVSDEDYDRGLHKIKIPSPNKIDNSRNNNLSSKDSSGSDSILNYLGSPLHTASDFTTDSELTQDYQAADKIEEGTYSNSILTRKLPT